MRVVICDYSGHPFQVQLSRELARRGHEALHLHFSEFQTPKGSLERKLDDPPGFYVQGVSLGRPFAKNQLLKRRFQEVKVGKRMAETALAFKPDVVVGCNMPLDAQERLQRGTAEYGAAFVFWLQDVYSSAISHYLGARLGFSGRVIGSFYTSMEKHMLRKSEAVVAISESFNALLQDWGIDRDKVTVIPNWAPLTDIQPCPKDNPWARQHGLQDKRVALYSGTLGLKHDPQFLLDLAQKGRSQGLQVVVVSQGPAIDWLTAERKKAGVDNLLLLPFQPMESYPQVLGAADIVLAMVGEEAAGFSVPSKVLSYLAAGKPIVASIKQDNDAARMIVENECGRVSAPGDWETFADSAIRLTADEGMRTTMGANGRRYAEREFDIAKIAARFEVVFASAIRRKAGAERRHPAYRMEPRQVKVDERR